MDSDERTPEELTRQEVTISQSPDMDSDNRYPGQPALPGTTGQSREPKRSDPLEYQSSGICPHGFCYDPAGLSGCPECHRGPPEYQPDDDDPEEGFPPEPDGDDDGWPHSTGEYERELFEEAAEDYRRHGGP